MEFIDHCKNVIEIDSSIGNSPLEMAEYVSDYCKSLGFKTTFHKFVFKGVTHANLLIETQDFPAMDYELVLQSHLDTLDPGPFGLWEKTGRNPYKASIHKGRVYGLGAADCKLDFLCKIEAATHFLGRSSQKPFALVGTTAKESGIKGAVELVRKQKIRAKKILVGEPTGMQLVTAGKGFAKMEIDIPFSEKEIEFRQNHDLLESVSTESRLFSGTPSHSSRPELGVNAIEKMFDYLENLPDNIAIMEMEGGFSDKTIPLQAALEFAIDSSHDSESLITIKKLYSFLKTFKGKLETFKDIRFKPETTTFNIATAETLPDRIRLQGSVRWPPVVSNEMYRGWMQEIKDFCVQNGAEISFNEYIKPFATDEGGSLVQSCQNILQSICSNSKVGAQSVTNEANCFSRFGMETVVFGPGDSERNSQTPKEYVLLSDLEKSKQFYEKLIEQVCF